MELESDRFWWWHGGALTASLLTALAAVFVFLAARGLVRPLPALLVALAFGLGSCAWPVSSQALWQHPASSFCLSLGAWLLLRSGERPRAAAWCGAALGMAVLCRPATAVVVVCVGAYLLGTDRRRCAYYVLGGLPLLVILAAYNGYYFGSPLVFGQTVASKIIFLRDTGSEHLWQSSWRDSLPGLLLSPSRGLVWFSPVLLLGLVSAVAVWREPRYRILIPLQAAVVLMILVAGKWSDWSGGLTWGYRSIVDTAPVPGPADHPRQRTVVRRPRYAGAVRRAAAVVGRRAVRGRLELQRCGLAQHDAPVRRPEPCQRVAVAAAADRLAPRQLRRREGAEKGADGGIRRRPENRS